VEYLRIECVEEAGQLNPHLCLPRSCAELEEPCRVILSGKLAKAQEGEFLTSIVGQTQKKPE
jgi:hypothetical protein